MLILSRKTNERIIIGEDIEIAVVDIRGDQVKLGIVAPKNVKVYRQEVFDAIQEENRKASAAASDALPSWEGLLPGESDGSPGGAGGLGSPGGANATGGFSNPTDPK